MCNQYVFIYYFVTIYDYTNAFERTYSESTHHQYTIHSSTNPSSRYVYKLYRHPTWLRRPEYRQNATTRGRKRYQLGVEVRILVGLETPCRIPNWYVSSSIF